MKTKLIIITLLIFASHFLSAQNTLNQYLETAGKNNPALKAKFNEYMATLEKVKQVGTLPDPQLAFGYFVLPVVTKNGPQQAKISISQMFPWFGTLNSKESIYVNLAKSEYENFKEVKSKLFFEVKSTYYDLYFIKKSIDITLEDIRILKTFKSLALIKIEAGKSSGVDELRVEMKLADLENDLALYKDKWFVNTVKFNNLLNVETNSPIEIPDSLWTDDIILSKQAIVDSLETGNHQLQSLDFLNQSFVSKQNLAKKEGTPAFLIGADYTVIGNDGISPESGNDGLLLKVGISIPLYRKKYAAMVNEVILLQQATQNKKEDKINGLETLAEKVYSEYLDANRRIDLFRKQSRLAKKAMAILESEYAVEGKNFEEILRMEKQFLQYNLQLEKARADKQAAIAFIYYLIGK